MPSTADYYEPILQRLDAALKTRILVLDGAMGTMIQSLGLDKETIHGKRFANHPKELSNFTDILCLTRPDDVTAIHKAYLEAGADIIETNTLGSTPIGMAEFGLPPELTREINIAAVACARRAIDEFAQAKASRNHRERPDSSERTGQSGPSPHGRTSRMPERFPFIACSIGPTTKQTAISTRVDNPAHRDVAFNAMADSYYQQVAAAIEAGVDILLPETAIDTLNLKACLFAISRYFAEHNIRVPVMASGTFSRGGATFVSGQSIEAFWNAISHFPLLSVGMNCALGPRLMRPHLEELARIAPIWTSCHPNAGLPNEMGEYDLP
ncbi:MAG: homocysteine S-methyltransferase family protein, partial [Pirellulales bacterium]|nr:homocysteine S-methyltransferase family protein [Pirellulales bacterium]